MLAVVDFYLYFFTKKIIINIYGNFYSLARDFVMKFFRLCLQIYWLFFKKNYDFFVKIVALVSIPHPSGDNDNNEMIYIFNFRSTTSRILTISIYVHIHGGKMMTK